jgi:hypothetical protein
MIYSLIQEKARKGFFMKLKILLFSFLVLVLNQNRTINAQESLESEISYAATDALSEICNPYDIKQITLNPFTGTNEGKELVERRASVILYYCPETEDTFHVYLEAFNLWPNKNYQYEICINGKIGDESNMQLQKQHSIWGDGRPGPAFFENEKYEGYCNFGRFSTDEKGNAKQDTQIGLLPARYDVKFAIKLVSKGWVSWEGFKFNIAHPFSEPWILNNDNRDNKIFEIK